MSALRLSTLVMILCCVFTTTMLNGQDFVKKVDIKSEQASFKLDEQKTLFVEIAGPADYHFSQEIDQTNELSISNIREDGTNFEDGTYTLQVTPIIKLPADQLAQLQDLREKRDANAIQQFRQKHNLPEEVHAYTYTFSIKNGKFVYPKLNEKAVAFDRKLEEMGIAHPDLYASINPVEMTSNLNLPNDNSALFAQVFTTDVIIQASLCVGVDCPTNQSFGFDTQILKENNLRILFDDTSNSASFPNNDWRLQANDSTNGGRSYFAIQDATSSRIPFQIEAGARANALVIEDDGDIGIGTATPAVDVVVQTGNTPTYRMAQDGSSGFSSQTWDIAGNEANFFIRDVTNGSQLPFKIRPGADDNSIVIDNDNNIGIGVLDATEKLDIFSGNLLLRLGNATLSEGNLTLTDGNLSVTGTSTFTGDATFIMTTGVSYLNPSFNTTMRVDATNNRVGVALGVGGVPGHSFEVGVDDAAKPNGGTWTAASDRRLKENIESFTDGLDVIMKMNPVRYNYNGKLGYPTEKRFVGVIAQEMKAIAPYTVMPLKKGKKEDKYLAYDGTPVTYLLVNAIKDQQKIIDDQNEKINNLEAQVAEINELKSMLVELSSKVAELSSSKTDNSRKTKNSEEE